MSEGSKPQLRIYLLIAYVIPCKWPKKTTVRTFNQTIRNLRIDAPTEHKDKVYPWTGIIPVSEKILKDIIPNFFEKLDLDRRSLGNQNGVSAYFVIKESEVAIASPYCIPPPTNWMLPPGELTLLDKYAITFNQAKKNIAITEVNKQSGPILLKGHVQNSNFRRQKIKSFYRKVCKNSRSVYFVEHGEENVFDKIACIDLEGIEMYKSGRSDRSVILDIVVDGQGEGCKPEIFIADIAANEEMLIILRDNGELIELELPKSWKEYPEEENMVRDKGRMIGLKLQYSFEDYTKKEQKVKPPVKNFTKLVEEGQICYTTLGICSDWILACYLETSNSHSIRKGFGLVLLNSQTLRKFSTLFIPEKGEDRPSSTPIHSIQSMKSNGVDLALCIGTYKFIHLFAFRRKIIHPVFTYHQICDSWICSGVVCEDFVYIVTLEHAIFTRIWEKNNKDLEPIIFR